MGERMLTNESLPPFRTEVMQMIKESGFPVLRIAKKMGISRSRLDYHLKGDKRINPEVLAEIRKAMNALNVKTVKINEKKSIPVFNYHDNAKAADAARFPILKKFNFIDGVLDMTEENIAGYNYFPHEGENAFFYVNRSDEMKDSSSARSIDEGDILLVDPDWKVISGDIVLVKIYGERELVRMIINLKDGKVLLKPFNFKYPELEVEQNDINHACKVIKKIKIVDM